MPIEIVIPRFGWSMEEGVFGEWLKTDGDQVEAGQPIFTLETDKAVNEVESTDSGTLHILPDGPQEGETVPVGMRVGFLLADGESPSDVNSLPDTRASGVPDLSPSVAAATSITSTSTAVSTASTDVLERVRITPRAKRVAAELNVAFAGLVGTGKNGRIRERDVRAAATAATAAPAAMSAISPLRKTIADRMMASVANTAPVTLTTRLDATNLVSLRQQFRAARQSTGQAGPSYTDILAQLTAVALAQHPLLNSRWHEDTLVASDAVHLGIAVDTQAGLLVPVIRNVQSLTLKQFAEQSRDLIERARRRQLASDEMQGGTFTITNLGEFGIDAFTPIINFPETAILGVGAIRREPTVIEDRIEPRDQMTLSLTFDHRAVDGAPAAQFLATVRECVENPGPWLMS